MKDQITLLVILSPFYFICTVQAHYGAKYEPPDGTLYHGVGWNYHNSMRLYSDMFPPEHHPLILQVNTAIPGTRGTDVMRVIGALTNNIMHPDSQYIEYSVHFQGRDPQMLDSVFALTDRMDGYIDTLAIAFAEVGRPIFLRIGFEFNGNWNPYHPYIYPLAFRKLAEGIRERGFDDFATVWCYEADADADFADSTEEGWKWYPGDDIVDWFGLDPFDAAGFDPAEPDSNRRGLTKKGKTEAFLRFARERGKPVYLNEFSAVRIDITPDEQDEDSTEGRDDWEAFFVPFFEFLADHPEIKGLNYIDIEWNAIDHYRELGWMDARLEINSYIRNCWVSRLMEDRFINVGYDITRELNAPVIGEPLPDELNFTVAPNPFNGRATVRFNLPHPGGIELNLYDINGRLVTKLAQGRYSAGNHSLPVDMSLFPSGVYTCALKSSGGRRTVKVVVVN